MHKIEWKSDYSVGVHYLDEQRKNIINVINLLIDNPNIFNEEEKIEGVFSELDNYVSTHDVQM